MPQDLQPYFDRNKDNFHRIEGLIKLHDGVRRGLPRKHKMPSSDILRACVVLIHASLEDFLRGLVIAYVPEADEAIVNDIPLLGISAHRRPERFWLGKLVAHRDKTVDELIRASVAEHVENSTFNSITEISNTLKSIKVNVDTVNAEFALLDELMQRRHQIVHRGDRTGALSQMEMTLQPIHSDQVKKWMAATNRFIEAVLSNLYDIYANKIDDLPA